MLNFILDAAQLQFSPLINLILSSMPGEKGSYVHCMQFWETATMIYTISCIFDICYYSICSLCKHIQELTDLNQNMVSYVSQRKKEEMKSDAFWLFLL